MTRPELKEKLHEIIFEADTPAGKAFDVTIMVLIVLSVIVVMLETVDFINQRFALLFSILEKHQMILMGKLALSPNTNVVRSSIFMPDGIILRVSLDVRKRGRPRSKWSDVVLHSCISAAGSYAQLCQYWHRGESSIQKWKDVVNKSVPSQIQNGF